MTMKDWGKEVQMREGIIRLESIQLTAFQLKVIAMVAMLCDHAAKTIVFGFDVEWLLWIGRIAFPIFAYQLVEGYTKTRDLKKYCKRLFIFALISEIPYNLIADLSSIINPFAQNVLWTMLMGVLVLWVIEKVLTNNKLNIYTKALLVVAIIVGGYALGTFTMVDYSGAGVLTFVLFYFSRKSRYRYIIELVGMIVINVYILQGLSYVLELGKIEILFPLQGLAIFSLIPIWFYKGQQGYHSKNWTRFCYWFYPLHILLLVFVGYLQSF